MASVLWSKSLILPNKNLKVFLILRYWSDTRLKISSDATISLLKSVEAIQRRRISAPNVSQIFWGAITFPIDLDCLRPSSSTTNPCVRTDRYGGMPLIAMPVNSEDWNQPLCWSEPSRYKSAMTSAPYNLSKTHIWVTPESNHTSKVSRTFVYWSASSIMVARSRLSHPSIPSCSMTSAISLKSMFCLGWMSPVSPWIINGIGTPQFLCLEMHQSGLSSNMDKILWAPHSGSQVTCETALIAPSTNPDFFIEINHWGVAIKINGVLCLQQWGYECSYSLVAMRALASCSNSITTGSPFLVLIPANDPYSSLNMPLLSRAFIDSSLCLMQIK